MRKDLVIENTGYKLDGSTISRIKKKVGYVTDYPTSDKSMDLLIPFEKNIKLISKNIQHPLLRDDGGNVTPPTPEPPTPPSGDT